MTIREYLDKRSSELDRQREKIRDFRVFDFNYMPDEPLMRREAGPIIDACLRYLHTQIPNHLFIFGSRGCGKTLMVRYIGQLLRERHHAHILYVNCRQHNTSFKLLAHLLGTRPRGYSLDELWRLFCDRFGREPLILLLDEVDLLSDKDRHKDILYLISRSSHRYMAVLLSNHPRFMNVLDESIRSSLQAEVIHFRNYDAEHLLQILRDRARVGLVEPPHDALPRIAGLTVKTTNSDVRVAIKTLYYFALEPEADIDALLERARRDLVMDILTDLNPRALLILKAAESVTDPLSKAVYSQYRAISLQLREEPSSYVHFHSNLAYLQSIGLITLVSTKLGRTYTNRIQLLFDPALFQSIWRLRFDE